MENESAVVGSDLKVVISKFFTTLLRSLRLESSFLEEMAGKIHRIDRLYGDI